MNVPCWRDDRSDRQPSPLDGLPPAPRRVLGRAGQRARVRRGEVTQHQHRHQVVLRVPRLATNLADPD